MTTPTYDEASPLSIETFGQRLLGSTLRETPGVGEIAKADLEAMEGLRFKGKFGYMLEVYYGINPGNEPCSPDFKEAGVELKTNSLNRGRRGFTAKERLSLSMIDYFQIVDESFDESCYFQKNKSMMLISRRYVKDGIYVDAQIDLARLIEFDQLPLADQQIIRADWLIISDKVNRGEAHLLSSSDTKYLEAATKGTVGARRVPQPNSNELAQPRAFALKAGFVTSLVKRYLNQDPDYLDDDEQLVITEALEVETKGFEAIIIEKFTPFLGMTIDSIEAELGVRLNRESKSYRAALAKELAKRIMGVTTPKIAEFQRAGIEMKTVLIDANGLPDQHMSFPAFRYMGEGSILSEDWEAVETDFEDEVDVEGAPRTGEVPRIKQILEGRRFLFVVFKSEQDTQVLENILFWSMPIQEIEEFVRPVWQLTFDSIRDGRVGDLPKTSFNRVCHVRPHGRTSKDTFPTPLNGAQPKKSFWLDKRYIQVQIN